MIGLGVLSVLFLVLWFVQNKEKTSLAMENGRMKERLAVLEEKTARKESDSNSSCAPVTADNLEKVVTQLGLLPERNDKVIFFTAGGERYVVDVSRLPVVFVVYQGYLDTKEWEMDILKQVVPLVSDDVIMVKGDMLEGKEGTAVRFYVTTLDANTASFKHNLPRYISIIADARERMEELYQLKIKERRDAALEAVPFLPDEPADRKVMS